MPKVIIRLGADEQVVELTAEVTTIGRSGDCVLPIRHKSLSRLHCEIRREGDGYVIRDCGSMNGTAVNGKRLTAEHRLEAGDRIDVGLAHVYFEEAARKARSGRTPPPAAAAREPVVVPDESPVLPASYAAWSRRGARGAGWGVGLAAAVAVLIAGYWGIGAWLAPSAPPEDAGNLLAAGPSANPAFEAPAPEGLPPGWRIPIGTQSRVGIQRGDARQGRQCLVVEKAAAPAEFVLACVSETAVELHAEAAYEVTGWVRAQDLKGAASLRCVVRDAAGPGAPPAAEAFSAPVAGTTDWTEVRVDVPAVPHAKTVTVECVVAGPSGRAQFDAIRVASRGKTMRAEEGADFKFRDTRVLVRPDGVFHLLRRQEGGRWKRILSGARFVLRTRNGTVDAAYAAGRPAGTPAAQERPGGPVTLTTHVLHPGTLAWIPVRQELAEADGEFRVACELAGEGLRPEDEIGMEMACPLAGAGATARVETDAGEKDADVGALAVQAVRRFLWRDGEAACTVRYPPYDVSLTGGRRGGALRLEQFVEAARAWPEAGGDAAPRERTGPAFALGLTVTLQREIRDLAGELERAAAAEAQGRLGEALEVYQQVGDLARAKNELGTAAEAEARTRGAAVKAAALLAAARRQALAARLVPAPEAVAAAGKSLEDLDRRLAGGRFADDLRQLRGELDAARAAGGAGPGGDPAGQVFRLAAHHLQRGDRALGRELLDFFFAHYKDSPVAPEAEKLRDSAGAEKTN